MEIFSQLNENKNTALALGYFDGVHKGHQAVIKSAVNFAKSQNKKSAVITFKDHPCCFFWGVCPKYILTRQERRNLIEKLGVDYLYELDFEKISQLSADEYFKNIILKYFSPISISAGFNHNFGANKSGDANLLKQYAQKYNFKYFMLEPEKYNNDIISSTQIRNLLSAGEINVANNMLGYNFSIEGTVVKGQQLGRQLGFNTANVLYPKELIDLPFGVYATKVNIAEKIYNAITNFGIRPTVSNKNICTIESHIFNFNDDIYNKNIRIEFISMLRKEQKYSSLSDLKRQISHDIELCKTLF